MLACEHLHHQNLFSGVIFLFFTEHGVAHRGTCGTSVNTADTCPLHGSSFSIIHHIFCILATALLLWKDRAGNTHAPFCRAAKSGWLLGSATVSGILGWDEKGRDEMEMGELFEALQKSLPHLRGRDFCDDDVREIRPKSENGCVLWSSTLLCFSLAYL